MRKDDQIHSQTRKYLLAFCDLFNDTFVIRYNDNLQEISYKRVPLIIPYSEKWYSYQKNLWLTNKKMNPEALFELAKTLPSIFVGDIGFSRKLEKQHNKYEMLDSAAKIYTPVSYELSLKITVMTELFDDILQIMEQILPGFAPSYSINVNPIPGVIENESIPIYAGDPSMTFPFDMDMETERIFTLEIPFTMDVNYYPEYYNLISISKTLEIE